MEEKGLDIRVKEIMTVDPDCCTPEATVLAAAELMRDCDCGAIPVVDGRDRRPVGILTDRDIVVRAVAEGLSPENTPVTQCMSTELAAVGEDATFRDVKKVMEERKVRRVLVVDSHGALVGLVPMAKVARLVPEEEAGEVIGAISEP